MTSAQEQAAPEERKPRTPRPRPKRDGKKARNKKRPRFRLPWWSEGKPLPRKSGNEPPKGPFVAPGLSTDAVTVEQHELYLANRSVLAEPGIPHREAAVVLAERSPALIKLASTAAIRVDRTTVAKIPIG